MNKEHKHCKVCGIVLKTKDKDLLEDSICFEDWNTRAENCRTTDSFIFGFWLGVFVLVISVLLIIVIRGFLSWVKISHY